MAVFFFSSCENDQLEIEWTDVTVIGEGVDCRDNWIIEYQSSETELVKFQEIGLPSEYKIEGLQLKLKFREPREEESFPCTTLGVALPFKVILEARKK